MTFGALVAACAGDAFLGNQVGFMGDLAGPAAIAFLIYFVILVGKLTVNVLNAYGGFMSILTTVTAFNGQSRISSTARTPLHPRFHCGLGLDRHRRQRRLPGQTSRTSSWCC